MPSPFWTKVRAVASAASSAYLQTFRNRPSGALDGAALSARQQAMLTGHGPGWWTSDHLEELRHMLGWIYVGVNAVADQWMQSTVKVYDKGQQERDELLRSGGRSEGPLKLRKGRGRYRYKSASEASDTEAEQLTPLPDHPAAKLLDSPNPVTSGAVFRYQIACQVRLTGGVYIWEVKDQYGYPRHLWVIPRGWLRPIPPSGQLPDGGFNVTPVFNTFTQSITTPSTSGWVIDRRDIIAFGRPDPLYPGEFKSPLSACSQIIDIAEQTDTATWSKFRNEVRPGLVFSLDPKFGGPPTKQTMDQFVADLKARKAGAENFGESLVAHGLTVQQMQAGPAELDYVNGRNQNKDFLLSVQRVPAAAAGIAQETSYAGLAVAIKQMVELSIEPDLKLFTDAMTMWGRRYWGKDFKVEAAARNYDDPQLKQQKAGTVLQAIAAGVKYTHDEVRALTDHPPLPDGEGEEYVTQQQPEQEGAPPEDPYAQFDGSELDLGDEMGDETSTGIRQPLRQESSGNMNGRSNGAITNGRY